MARAAMARWTRSWILPLVLSVGCRDEDAVSLQRDDVTNLPPGTAVGSAASGRYEVESYTSECAGRCRAGEGWLSFVVCDVGNRDQEVVEVVQEEGRLQVDGGEHLFISRMRGGVDADGRFEVGGYGTEAGGSIEATGRLEGQLEGARVDAIFDVWVRGTYGDDVLDCKAQYEVAGTKHGH
jgi:hypothetical protein